MAGRATAAASIWIHVTRGEHPFAPNRRSPATIPGAPRTPASTSTAPGGPPAPTSLATTTPRYAKPSASSPTNSPNIDLAD
ncbi:hypothetical protein GCM10010170_021370 [Dactylosporangium salmoneum]|uniref:Uncharacterized protein n=1 Tax=Dactylosporangium salmoneum TaxID=53361 RepID=A0ABN3FXR6_9ACTN